MKKLIPWVGGKASLAGEIVPLIPPHTCYVELFAGGAGVFCAKERSKVEVLNDLNCGLITLFRVWQRHPDAFLEELRLVVASRKWYEDCWAQPGLTDVERSARFFYRVRHSFANQPGSKSFAYSTLRAPGIKADRVEAAVREIHGRLRGVLIECLTWDDALRRYDREHTFFYIDPPYYKVSCDYGPGLNFSVEDHGRLAAALRKTRGTWILSLNDVPGVRALYAGLHIKEVQVFYGMGYGTRTQTRKKRAWGEVLVSNRPWLKAPK